MVVGTTDLNSRETQLANLRALIKESNSKQSAFYTLNATKKRMNISARLFRKAYRKDSFVAWRTSFVPSEIFFALDIVPFPAETIIAMFADSNIAAKILGVAEENNYSRDACSFLRGTIGASILNILPIPDVLVCTSLYCDASAKTFYSLSKKYNRPYFFIDIPYNYDSKYCVTYVAAQLESMVKEIAKIKGIKLDYNKLSQCIENANRAKSYYISALEFRQRVPSPILGGEAIDYAIMLSHLWGSNDAVTLYKMFYEELKNRSENKESPAGKEEFRILWRQLRPYYSNEIFKYLELENKAVIAFEEVNYIYWEDMDPQKPFISLAKKLLANPPLGPFQRWLDLTIRDGVEKYKVDGVIEFAQWGCRHLNSGTQILKEKLRETDIPMLVIDGDCIDRRDYSWSQIKNRIDAFLEILKRKKDNRR